MAPSLIGTLLLVLLPFLDAVRRSFFTAMSGQFVGLSNYQAVLDNQAFRLAVHNTLKFTGICVPLLVLFSLLLALLVRGAPGSGVIKTLLLLPMAIPVAAVVLIWQALFHENGFLSAAVEALGGRRVDWMNNDAAFWVLTFSYIWRNAGYDLVLWLAGLASIAPELYEAAGVDGAGGWQTFLHITLPSLLPSLFTISVLSLLNSFKVFREAYLVAGDHPHRSIYLLQHLFNNWFTDLEVQKLCAAATLVALVILMLVLALKRAWGSEERS